MKVRSIVWRNGYGRNLRVLVFSLSIMAVLGGCPLPIAQQHPAPNDQAGLESSGIQMVLDYDLQHYVPVPAAGAVAVTELERQDLRITVQWKNAAGSDINAPNPFILHEVYQAEITLDAKSPYIFNVSIPFRYLTAEAELKGNNADTKHRILNVSYKPAEVPPPISDIYLTPYIPAPVTGNNPVTWFSAGTYGGEVQWQIGATPVPAGIFQPDSIYTARVTMTPAQGYRFAAECNVTHSGGRIGAFSTSSEGRLSGIITFFATDVTLISRFSADFGTENDSVIDLIRAGRGRSSLNLRLIPEIELLELKQGTDLGEEGLILKYDPSNLTDPDITNSPGNLIIDGDGLTLNLSGTGSGHPLITVGNGVTLTLRNITLKGLASSQNANTDIQGDDDDNNSAPMFKVKNGGKLIIEGGVLITENDAGDTGGVHVESGGEFIMNDGAISRTTGAVKVDSGGTFTMNNGTIRDNKSIRGTGVDVDGIFTMNNGTISGNTATYDNGGGVWLNGNGQMIMNGGTISGNTATDKGGGVSVGSPENVFIISGGTISGNTAGNMGGGVYIAGGACAMNYGTISGNTAANSGGGVCAEGGVFSMNYGIINGNKVTNGNGNGGGVYIENGVFTMSLGIISGNGINPSDTETGYGNGKGCGVYVKNNGTFRKTGGTINGLVRDGIAEWEDANQQNYYNFQVDRSGGSHVVQPYSNTASGTPGGYMIGYAVYFDDGGGGKWRDLTAGPGCDLSTDASSLTTNWNESYPP
ncbi:MAG: right-handed parallel beta-helix repeat-containing protein [Treponema sp.]|nr:right-handed parallel beta-helix repeat-containing protein [Treponema sp.]